MEDGAGRAPELPYLEAFRIVCAEGGFSAAARRLGCSQPAVSYQVRRLEQVVGASLLERGGRRIVLTAEGERLRVVAEEVAAELARLRSESVAGHALVPLRLGSASGFGRYVLVPALHKLREEQHEQPLEIRLQYDAADVVLDNLDVGRYDAAFVYKRRITSALSYEPVYSEELVLIAGPKTAEAITNAGAGRLQNFGEVPFVTYEECDYVFGRWFETAFGAQPPRLVSSAHFTELEEVVDFVQRDVGAPIVPRDSVEAVCATGAVAVMYAGCRERCLNQVFMVTRTSSKPSGVLRRLAAHVGARDSSIPV